MKNILCTFIACLIAISLKSQSDWTTKTFDVASSFTEIVATSGINLKISEGATNSLTYACNNKEYLENVKVENINNRVTISMKNQGSSWYKNVKCEGNLTMAKDATFIESSHGSNLSIGDIDVKEITIISSNGSNLSGSLKGKTLATESKKGSNLKLSGTFDSVNCISTGGSNLDTKKISAKECTVQVTQGSNATIAASDSVIADAIQGSNITVIGNTNKIKKSKDKSSNISIK